MMKHIKVYENYIEKKNVKNIRSYIEEEYGDYIDKFYISEDPEGIVLDAMILKPGKKEEGIGSKIMMDLTNYADKSNKIMALTPSTNFGGAKGELVRFYKKFGFVMNKGENKDLRFKESMVRFPEVYSDMGIYNWANFGNFTGIGGSQGGGGTYGPSRSGNPGSAGSTWTSAVTLPKQDLI